MRLFRLRVDVGALGKQQRHHLFVALARRWLATPSLGSYGDPGVLQIARTMGSATRAFEELIDILGYDVDLVKDKLPLRSPTT